MNSWINIFWVACAVMGCWSLSLLVRWCSETIARRRKRLATKYSKRAGWIALGLMVVCAGMSVISGYVALEAQESSYRDTNPWLNSATVGGWSVAGFGVFMLVWWVVGDPARGRVRCPRCWYDMSGAASMEGGLRCPECGKAIKSDRKLLKSRRPRWMVVMAVVLMGGGWYGVVAGPRVAETGEWLAAVPTWVLMAGWEVFPNEWIYLDTSSASREYQSRLQRRIRGNFDVEWTYPIQTDIFRKHVLHDRGSTLDSRWSPRRRAIMEAVVDSVGPSAGAFFFQTPDDRDWQHYDHDQIADLYHTYTADLLDMLESPEESSEYESTLDDLVRRSGWGNGLALDTNDPQVVYRSCFYLTKPLTESVDPEDFKIYESTIAHELSAYQDRINSEPFLKNFSSEYPARLYLAFDILYSSQGMVDHLDDIFVASEGPHLQYLIRFSSYIAYSTEARHDQSSLNRILDRCNDWIRSGEQGKQAIGYSLLSGIQRKCGLNADSVNPHYLAAYATAMELGSKDNERTFPDWVRSPELTTQYLLIHHDTTHEQSFTMVRDSLNDSPKDAPHIDGIVDLTNPYTVETWLRVFSDIQHHADPSVREWFEYNTPPRYAARDKALWDSVAAKYLDEQTRQDLSDRLPKD